MCLAVPFEIIEIDGKNGVGIYAGVRKNIRLDFIKNPEIGQFVMVHAGFAIEVLDREQAMMDIEAFAEMEEALMQ